MYQIALVTIVYCVFFNFGVYSICKHLKRISSSPVEHLALKIMGVNKTTRIVSVRRCGACVLQLRKQIKLFETWSFSVGFRKVSISGISCVKWTFKRCQQEIIYVTIPIKTFAYLKKAGLRS